MIFIRGNSPTHNFRFPDSICILKVMRLLPAMLVCPLIALGQSDTLVTLKDIEFRTEFERNAFDLWFTKGDKEGVVDLLVATEPNPESVIRNARERIDQISARLAPEISPKRKPEKYVKTIYDQVHAGFLQKYEPVIRFAEVFRNGYYNCVTATALYALVFEKLNIPYAIQEKPTHVFLVAYPNRNNILVETTTPVFGYLTYDTRYKENFIDNLKAQKLIGATEVQMQGTEELFNKYYFQSEDITLEQLVGIHYMNDALFYEDRKDLENALTQAEKAYLFYPSLRMKYLIMHFVVQTLATTQPKPLERAALIGRAARFSKLGITPDMIKGEFAMLTETVLTRNNNKPLYRQCYEIVDRSIEDPELKKDIGYYYYFEIGRQYFNQGAYTQAKNYFAKGMEYQPNNAELGSIFIAVLANSIRNETKPKALLDTLQSYQERFSNLKENNKFLTLMAIGCLMAYEEAMRDGKPAAGEAYQSKFESIKASNPDVDAPMSLVGSAYSAAGSYYFRKGQKAKARAIIDRGLEFAPGEYQLRQRRQMIN